MYIFTIIFGMERFELQSKKIVSESIIFHFLFCLEAEVSIVQAKIRYF